MNKKTSQLRSTDPHIRVTDAINHFGNQSRLAKVLELSRATVCGWQHEEFVPPLAAYRLCMIRPEVFGSELHDRIA